MDIELIDYIPYDDPHCKVCAHWDDGGELFGYCEVEKGKCPSFAVCDNFNKVKQHKS